jgi:electron transport complex protein RnfB
VSLLLEQLNAALPQTQCTRCGYPDCAAYANAIAAGSAEINQCPPGGAEGVSRLADLTGRPLKPLNPANGSESPRSVAVIDEAWCIGCTLCLPVCPTDAIMGSNKRMHTVIESHCTGCELCVAACPVDCISLEIVSGSRKGWQAWSESQADDAAKRYEAHKARRSRTDQVSEKTPEIQTPIATAESASPTSPPAKRDVIAAALARAREKRGSSGA